MFTAEAARVMTQHAINALSDRYYNVYRNKVNKAIEEAIVDGKYEAILWFSLDDSHREEGFNRLVDALINDYHYDITTKLTDKPLFDTKGWLKISWEEKVKNSGS